MTLGAISEIDALPRSDHAGRFVVGHQAWRVAAKADAAILRTCGPRQKLHASGRTLGSAAAGDIAMIARMWHGITPTARADAYLEFLKARALPDYRKTPGNRGAFILRRIEGATAHFTTISHWESLEAIAAFAGDDIARAKYYPEDQDYLLEFEPTVVHSELYS